MAEDEHGTAPNYVSDEELADYRKAGRIAAEALKFGAKLITPGKKVVDVLDQIEERIRELGGEIAFPAQASLNDVAAHFCPEENDQLEFKEGDLVKLDVGAHVNGCVGDNALSVDLSANGEHAELIKASREARDAAIKLVRPGVTPNELGKAIHEVITSYGFSPVKNLSGHGVGHYQIHTPPSIPNYPSGDETPLEASHVIAIEPFATDGQGMIFNSSNPTLFAQVKRGRPRGQYARDALKLIESYNGLPFTTRWLTRKLGEGKTKFGLRELLKLGIISDYPQLPEKGKGLVSQSEHTVLIFDKAEILTKSDD